MLFTSLISTAAVALLSATSAIAADLPTIEIVGNKFFYSNNGSQFYIKGVAYQADVSNSSSSSFTDPLADGDSCKRDIPYLQELSTNVIRVYAVNASLDHTDCLQQFNDAGIYVIADLAEPSISITTDDPSWNLQLYDRYTKIIDLFADHSNVLGFFAGNEVINNVSTSDAAPFVKAAIRDMKQYMSDKDYRDIPIGYSATDSADSRVASADYFACGDEDVRADFYGINMYEWCGSSTFATSGYKSRTEDFKNLTIPVFFSEYGCNAVQPRKFTEVKELYSDDMTDVWSGGIVYMYFQEANDYGLVSVNDDGKASTMADFNYLKSELASVSPSSASTADVTANTKSNFACPTTGKSFWLGATALPPTPDEDFCNCADAALSCVVSSDVDEDDYADLFSYLCGVVSCDDVNGNGTTGKYGDYSFCSAKVKLNYLLNKYYESQDSSDDACSFSGSATINSSASTAKSCTSILSGATGSSDNATAGSGSNNSGSGSATDSSSDSTATSGSGSSSSKKTSTKKSSSSKSAASSLYSRKYAFSISELSMTLLASTTLLVGVCVFAL